ncbi:MAG: substrate-binding domain-containing protein [Pseudomonadota bacterium]|nr:substrate-binding domain-containing protein [Pseudomonadota bacterium]
MKFSLSVLAITVALSMTACSKKTNDEQAAAPTGGESTASTDVAATGGGSRDNIQIAGSSTVLPFASIVAEEFGQNFPQFKTPVVGSGGSGGGLRQFCQGTGANTIDIANSSRKIGSEEIENCKKSGVTKIHEVMFGYDGIVFASDSKGAKFALTPKTVFLAGAAKVPQNGQMVDNPYNKWSEIDASLPDQAITLVIPGSNHGTREVFEEKVHVAGCKEFTEVQAMDKDAQKDFCHAMRRDGKIVEIAGDYTETLARLQATPTAVGAFGLSFYDQNRDRLQVATVNGIVPSVTAILDGSYPVSRPLYFYVKGEHIGVIPGIAEYTDYFLNARVSGSNSPLEKAGLIPLPDDIRAKALEDFKNRVVVQ